MLAELQEKFARCCRTGELEAVADVEKRRLEIYRKAIFGGILRVLNKAYPLTREALGEGWEPLVNEFFSNHECGSPELWKMPKGLCDYVEGRGTEIPWLLDLLRFEWLEIEVHMGPDVASESVVEGDIRFDPVVINPEHSLDHFTYPVWREKTDALEAGSHFLFTFRHPEICTVHFVEVSPLFAVAVSLLADRSMLVLEALEQACMQLKLSFDEQLCKNGIQFFKNMFAQGGALGFAKEKMRCDC